MKKRKIVKSWIAVLLVLSMIAGYLPAQASETGHSKRNLKFTSIEDDFNPLLESARADEALPETGPSYESGDVVRVSILLKDQATIDAGFGIARIAGNKRAMNYRDQLKIQQEAVTKQIEDVVLDGGSLDVVWNLTLAANIISANVKYGQIGAIKKLNGVADVFLEARYEPAVVGKEERNPNMATSSLMIGSNLAHASGYTGAGVRIAVIDTGIDDDHQSFDNDAYLYSLDQLAQQANMTPEAYRDSLDLLTGDDIAAVMDELNIAGDRVSESQLYRSEKIPFAYNYVDDNYIITHDFDNESEHGSHVSGISAANAYIPCENGYEKALDAVSMQGVAPDAQILTMKVFGSNGGAYDSDILAAIEDAMVLEADTVNLSLGSNAAGFSRPDYYESVLSKLTESGMVAVNSAGNNGAWQDHTNVSTKKLHVEDVNMMTGGIPGSSEGFLSVASVNNDGVTGMYFTVGNTDIFYSEAIYQNDPMTTIGGDQNYVYLGGDGYGTDQQIEAAKEAVKDSVVICNRGGPFSETANRVVKAGARGVVFANNEDGTFSMGLTDYTYHAPVVSITKASGAAMLENATPVTDQAGNTLYYTGTMHVNDQPKSVYYNSEYYTMSDFSSFGVPGSLKLKPEITAPGGNIYSVNGLDKSGKAYENMSGTSMAAPQISGMVALVDQYIEKYGLDQKTGMSKRALAQSLLMSTSVPLRDKKTSGYYTVLHQGSGLANVSNAVSAQSYILMDPDATDSWKDGKIKAELGDDPGREGEYSFSFTINNLNDKENSYRLATDLFTQAVSETSSGGKTESWLEKDTATLSADVSYKVGDQEYVPESSKNADVNKDGVTNALDAQVILDYCAGKKKNADIDLSAGDVDGDQKCTTYDAHLILKDIQTGAFVVPAGKSVKVTVNITLNDIDTLEKYVNGAYVEGYTYVNPVASGEGVLDQVHSIPILGFYGNWSDPSMYDHNNMVDSRYGDQTVPYVNSITSTGVPTNFMTYRDHKSGRIAYEIGNPYYIEETNPMKKAARNSQDSIYYIASTLIRNAAAMAVVITNDKNEVLYVSPPDLEEPSAYYANGVWGAANTITLLDRKFSDMGTKDGDLININLVSIPEYYETDGPMTEEDIKELYLSKKLGKGAVMTFPMAIDDEPPKLEHVEVEEETGNISIVASDNRYISYRSGQ